MSDAPNAGTYAPYELDFDAFDEQNAPNVATHTPNEGGFNLWHQQRDTDVRISNLPGPANAPVMDFYGNWTNHSTFSPPSNGGVGAG